MEFNPERQNHGVHFKNQPKLSGFEVDQKNDEKRVTLVPQIEAFIADSDLFRGKDVSVEFSHKGVSSLVSFLEVDGKKYVLKIPLSSKPDEGEVQFLRAWESVGVSVPHVHEEGKVGDQPYILMDYIDAQALMDEIKQGTAKEDIFIELGRILATMHTPKVEGYGRLINGEPQYREFKDWLFSEDIQRRVRAVQENNLLTDEHGSLTKAFDILTEYAEKNPTSTYCHFDYSATNILATEPPTVIDPNPMLNLGILDIARSIVLSISEKGSIDSAKQLKEGYFSGNTPYDSRALQAAIILNAYIKFNYWHKKKKNRAMENVRQYLAQTSHLL